MNPLVAMDVFAAGIYDWKFRNADNCAEERVFVVVAGRTLIVGKDSENAAEISRNQARTGL